MPIEELLKAPSLLSQCSKHGYDLRPEGMSRGAQLSMADADFGIREFLGLHDGFPGILKYRWEDFHVHEVTANGTILHLTEDWSRQKILDLVEHRQRVERGEGAISRTFTIPGHQKEVLLAERCFSADDLNAITELVHEAARRSAEVADEKADESHSTRSTGTEKDASSPATPKPEKQEPADVNALLFCIIRGDLARSAELLTVEHNAQETGSATVVSATTPEHTKSTQDKERDNTTVYLAARKKLRQLLHLSLREFFPFLCAETLPDSSLRVTLTVQALKFLFPRRICKQLLQDTETHPSATSTQSTLIASDPSATPVTETAQEESNPLLEASDTSAATEHNQLVSRHEKLSSSPSVPNRCTCSQRPPAHKKRRLSRKHGGSGSRAPPLCAYCASKKPSAAVARQRFRWPKERPPYLHFHLYKTNRDTAEAIQMISRCTGVNPRSFSFAGTKDRRAITVQAVTVRHVTIEHFQASMLHPAWDHQNIRVSNFSYVSERLALGQLSGNHFRVCIRNVPVSAEPQVDSAIRQLTKSGFINYFGPQRFGTRSVKTHHIGAQLLLKQYEKAVRMILGEAHFPKDLPTDPSTQDSLANDLPLWSAKYLLEEDATAALENLPRHLYIERQLLSSLHRFPRQFLKALQSLPKNTLTLYVHACQSIVWNCVASYRIRQYGRRPVVGDLVLAPVTPPTSTTEAILNKEPEEEEDLTAGEPSEPIASTLLEEEDFNPSSGVIALTTEDELNRYSIEDVVLPIPGHGIQQYPAFLLDVYREACNKMLSIEWEVLSNPTLKQLGDYSGGYRHICVRPRDINYNMIYLNTPEEASAAVSPQALSNPSRTSTPLLASDLDRLEANQDVTTRLTLSSVPQSAVANLSSSATASAAAVLFCCTLPKAAYLTMACRELMKGLEPVTSSSPSLTGEGDQETLRN